MAVKSHGAASAMPPFTSRRLRSSRITSPRLTVARPPAALTDRSTRRAMPVRQRSPSAARSTEASVPEKSRRCQSARRARTEPVDVRLPPSGTGRSGRRRRSGRRGTSGRSACHCSASVRNSSKASVPDAVTALRASSETRSDSAERVDPSVVARALTAAIGWSPTWRSRPVRVASPSVIRPPVRRSVASPDRTPRAGGSPVNHSESSASFRDAFTASGAAARPLHDSGSVRRASAAIRASVSVRSVRAATAVPSPTSAVRRSRSTPTGSRRRSRASRVMRARHACGGAMASSTARFSDSTRHVRPVTGGSQRARV